MNGYDRGMGLWIAVIVGVLLLIVIVAWMYNRLVTLRQRYMNAYAQIDVQLKRRYDLIPNLVQTVKGYMEHERQTFEQVIQARNAAADANARAAANPNDNAAIAAVAAAENQLLGLLGQIRLLVEDYPQLKADQQTARLMEELASAENRVAFARQAYNYAVTSYNTARETFPRNIVASIFRFTPAELFSVDEAKEREAVKVEL